MYSVADPKVPEKPSATAVEEKESEQSEDKTALKVLLKEEVETPELKVSAATITELI